MQRHDRRPASRLDGEPVEGGYSTGLYLDSGRRCGARPRGTRAAEEAGVPWSLETRGDLIVGEVERNGITILTATLPYKQQAVDPAELRRHFDFAENINYKVIPHVDGTPAIRQLTVRRLAEIDVHECWVGPCSVELRPKSPRPRSGGCRSASPSRASTGTRTSRSSPAGSSTTILADGAAP